MTDAQLSEWLRCPYCGGGLGLADNAALVRRGSRIESGVVGCDCCAFPIVAGIPVMQATDETRAAIEALEAGRHEDALLLLLEVDDLNRDLVRGWLRAGGPPTFRSGVDGLSRDAEGVWAIFRVADPTSTNTEALFDTLGTTSQAVQGPVLDMCGGFGHLSWWLRARRRDVDLCIGDMFFWKLWLAGQFLAPDALLVCCDGNAPLPFARGTFPTVVLSDAFPYIWHKRLLADEMMRLCGEDGLILMPHLHSSLGDNHSAGMTLTPAGYAALFAPMQPHFFRERILLAQAVSGAGLDLSGDASPEAVEDDAAPTMVACRNAAVFTRYAWAEPPPVQGELQFNPLYRVTASEGQQHLEVVFPTDDYADEFQLCLTYLPATLTLPADILERARLQPSSPEVVALRRQRVLLDLPRRYC